MKWKPFINSQGKEILHLLKKNKESLCGRQGKALKESKTKNKCKACKTSLGIMKRDIHISCGKCHVGYNFKKNQDFMKFISDHTHGYRKVWKSKPAS